VSQAPLFIVPRSGWGTCRQASRSVHRSVESTDLLWCQTMLGCTDLVHLQVRELPRVSGKAPKSVLRDPHIGRHGLGSSNGTLACLSSILSRFCDPRSSFAWVQSLVTFGAFLLQFVGPWIHGRGHMDTFSTLDVYRHCFNVLDAFRVCLLLVERIDDMARLWFWSPNLGLASSDPPSGPMGCTV